MRRVARGATSPLRGFFNQHFEMVKSEIRTTDQQLTALATDLESALIEQSLHQARAMSRVRADVERLEDRIAELERLIERLTDVVAAGLLDAGADGADGH